MFTIQLGKAPCRQKSAGGKARSRLNGIKHGLCSEPALLPGEDAQALADLHAFPPRAPARRLEKLVGTA